MLKWFKSRSKKKPIFDFPEVEAGSIEEHACAVEDVLDAKPAGFLIKNLLSPEEVELLLKGFEGLNEDEVTVVNEGLHFYPRSFAQFVQSVEAGELEAGAFHEKMSNFRTAFPERFGVDIEERVLGALGKLWPKADLQIPRGEDGKGSFAPFTFRRLLPGKGTLKPHCGHFFTHEFPGFYQRLSHFTNNECQFSFFILLKEAEVGGELTLYETLWEDAKKRPSDEVLQTDKGDLLDLNNPRKVARQSIRPGPGDMITFNGGDIWHRVETVQGTGNRITLGGFISFSRESNSLWFWS